MSLLQAAVLATAIAGVAPSPASTPNVVSVRGRGFRKLRAAGVEVETGVLEEACREQHRGFRSVCERGRPWVALKLATTLDGRIATGNGDSRWITGPKARAQVHRLRDRHDAVLVGSGTALADDPSLTVRRDGRVVRTPIRVVLDGRLRVPRTHVAYTDAEAERTWILCAKGARGVKARASDRPRLLEIARTRDGHFDLRRALTRLADEGLTTVLVEGGGALAARLLGAGLVDEVHWMLAAKLVGSDGRPGLGALGLEAIDDAIRLEAPQVSRLGADLYVRGRVASTADRDRRGTRRKR